MDNNDDEMNCFLELFASFAQEKAEFRNKSLDFFLVRYAAIIAQSVEDFMRLPEGAVFSEVQLKNLQDVEYKYAFLMMMREGKIDLKTLVPFDPIDQDKLDRIFNEGYSPALNTLFTVLAEQEAEGLDDPLDSNLGRIFDFSNPGHTEDCDSHVKITAPEGITIEVSTVRGKPVVLTEPGRG